MKKITVTLFAVLSAVILFAQAPQAFKYQTVVRDSVGDILANQAVSFRNSIRKDSINGPKVYVETHFDTTNQFGLVTLEIGNGIVETGVFENLDWGNGTYFLRIRMDATGGTNFQLMGTTQLLAVPYALHSENGFSSMSRAERDALINPPIGKQILNTNTNCINYYNGLAWFEVCGDCAPIPTFPNAGTDQYISDESVSTILEANTPEFGSGKWSIVSGNEGIIADSSVANSLFTGISCESYILRWTVSNPCDTNFDEVEVVFDAIPTNTTGFIPWEQWILDTTLTIFMEGNTPIVGEGLWKIDPELSGDGGIFADSTNPTTAFTGQPCESYYLDWIISTDCDSSYYPNYIHFSNTPTIADAGSDQVYQQGSQVATLNANIPENGLGYWTIINGSGGSIVDTTNPNSLFYGQEEVLYELEWTTYTECNTSSDIVIIHFGGDFQCKLPFTDIRDNQLYHTVLINDQCWMKENLNIGNRINSFNADDNQTDNDTIEKYCYDNNDTLCNRFGGLYQWDEMMQYTIDTAAQGICPIGWHIPTIYSWTALIYYLGGESVAGGKMKTTGYDDWGIPNTGATNSSGFSAKPGGARLSGGGFAYYFGGGGGTDYAYFWTSNYVSYNLDYAKLGALINNYGTSAYIGYSYSKITGTSVRCIKD